MNSTTGQVSTIARDTPRAFKASTGLFLERFLFQEQCRSLQQLCSCFSHQAETFSVQVDFIGSAENRVSFTLQVGPTKPALPENLAAP